jgi:hypothetical protein
MTRRLYLGLTDYERREKDANRRIRNCAIALAVLCMVLGMCDYLTM